jgi:GNAT superfamily N-acetyltransferase
MRTLILNGSAGERAHTAVLAVPAVLEFPELRQSQDYRDDVHRVVSSLSEFDRVEIVCIDDGKVIGGAVIVLDDDQHVGHCLSLQWQYVLPEYRCKRIGHLFVRELLRQAGWAGIKNVCYTHRVGVGKYTLTYREVKSGQESQGHHRQS